MVFPSLEHVASEQDGHLNYVACKATEALGIPVEELDIFKPETERLVQEELQNGRFRSVDEMIVEGVQARREATPLSRGDLRRKTPAEAVAHIRELRRGNRLPAGVTIRDLINEGRA